MRKPTTIVTNNFVSTRTTQNISCVHRRYYVLLIRFIIDIIAYLITPPARIIYLYYAATTESIELESATVVLQFCIYGKLTYLHF